MSLLDRFRPPKWKHEDPVVRAEAVRHLGPEEGELLAEMARGDADAQVRRAAVHRLTDVPLLLAAARDDADPGVREAAEEALLRIALATQDAALGAQALSGLSQQRHLVDVAREARVVEIQCAAVERLNTPRALATVARASSSPEARRAAVGRIEDAASLSDLARNCEHKEVAVAAVDRIADSATLEAVAAKARSKAASRQARARLASPPATVPVRPTPPPPASEVDADELARYEEARAAQEREAEARAAAVAARAHLCETVLAIEGEDVPVRLAAAEDEWARLEALPGGEGDALARRFQAAVDECRRRHQAWSEKQAHRARLEAVCAELEVAAELPDLREAGERVAALHKDWPVENVDADLQARAAVVVARLEARWTALRQAKEKKEADTLARVRELCGRMEALVQSAEPGLREAERALRDSRAALEDLGALPPRRDRDTLGARLKAARAALYPKVQELRESDEWKRWANASIQEELCRRVEALLETPDLPKVARALREIDERWKEARQAPKDEGEALWKRFKSARDQVKSRCDAFFAAEAARRSENRARKEALCLEAESLAESTDWVKTAERLQALQAEWKATGPIPRKEARRLWERFRAATGRFFGRRKEDRARRSGERKANLEKKEALCAQAEALAESQEWDKAQAEVKRLQSEWKAIGPVGKAKSDAVWQRFRHACDAVFERHRRRGDIEASGRRAAAESLCVELESLVAAAEPPAEGLAGRVRALQTAWRDAGAEFQDLKERFQKGLARVIEAHPEAFRATELDPEANRKKMEKLCEAVEALAPAATAKAESPAATLAQQWREALASNTMRGKPDPGARRREIKERVEEAQAAWSRLSMVPGEAGEALRRRFQQACRAALS